MRLQRQRLEDHVVLHQVHCPASYLLPLSKTCVSSCNIHRHCFGLLNNSSTLHTDSVSRNMQHISVNPKRGGMENINPHAPHVVPHVSKACFRLNSTLAIEGSRCLTSRVTMVSKGRFRNHTRSFSYCLRMAPTSRIPRSLPSWKRLLPTSLSTTPQYVFLSTRFRARIS